MAKRYSKSFRVDPNSGLGSLAKVAKEDHFVKYVKTSFIEQGKKVHYLNYGQNAQL